MRSPLIQTFCHSILVRQDTVFTSYNKQFLAGMQQRNKQKAKRTTENTRRRGKRKKGGKKSWKEKNIEKVLGKVYFLWGKGDSDLVERSVGTAGTTSANKGLVLKAPANVWQLQRAEEISHQRKPLLAGRGNDDERLQEDFDQLLLHSCQMKASLCPALCSLRENAGVQLYVRAGNRQSCVWTRQNPDRTPWK